METESRKESLRRKEMKRTMWSSETQRGKEIRADRNEHSEAEKGRIV